MHVAHILFLLDNTDLETLHWKGRKLSEQKDIEEMDLAELAYQLDAGDKEKEEINDDFKG